MASLVGVAALGLWAVSPEVPETARLVGKGPELVLDVNQAPREALAALPHFGPTLVSRLVDARSERPFSSLEDLGDRVRGIGPVTLARIAPHVRIEPAPGSGTEDTAGAGALRPAALARAPRRKSSRARKAAPIARPPHLAAIEAPSRAEGPRSPAP
jgi:hypothetical protein